MLKIKVITLFLALFYSCLASAESNLEVYFGTVDFGRGNGLAGHGFLLIKEKNQPYLLGDFYQYNLKQKNGDPLPKETLDLNFEEMSFSLDRMRFYEVLGSYTEEDDRTVSLFQLRLSESEINSLKQVLLSDQQRGSLGTGLDYDVLLNNCVTRIIENINRVVDPRQYISLYLPQGTLVTSSHGLLRGVRGALFNRAPFYVAKTLENHPVSFGRTRTFEKRSVREAKIYARIVPEIEALSQECRWSDRITPVIKKYYGMLIDSYEDRLFQPIVDLVGKSCPSSRHFYRSLLLLYQLVEGRDAEVGNRVYDVIMELNSTLEVQQR